MGGAPRGHQYRVDAGVSDEIAGGGVHGGIRQARGHLAGPLGVDVVDRDDGAAGEDLGDPADVVLADHADADHANPDSHECSLSAPMPTLRR